MKRSNLFLVLSLAIGSASVALASDYPTANTDSYTTTSDKSITFMPMDNDVGQSMYITEVNSPTPWGTGTTTFTGSKITYTPPADFTGETSFWYQIKDNQGRLTSAPITVKVSAAQTTSSAWPTALEDSASTTLTTAITIDPLANDTGDNLTITEVNTTTTAGSTVAIVDNKILYTPSSYATTGDSFWYVITDNQGRTNAAKITITIKEAETTSAFPTAGADTYTVTKDSTNNTLDIFSNDTGTDLAIDKLYEYTQQGGTTSESDGVITYNAPAGFTGTDDFWYSIVDANGNITAAQVTINVEESNDAGTSTGSTTGIGCDYSDSTYNDSASVLDTSTSEWSCTDESRVLTANGLPDHAVGIFPNAGNPDTISEQVVSATYTLAPVKSETATTLGGPSGPTGYVLNGVKIDAGTAGSCDDSGESCSLVDNSGSWSIEALGHTSFNFGADDNNAHVQPDGTYHYHGMPEGFLTKQGASDATMTLIGWAADGFPIYGRYGYSVATDATSDIKVVTGSYQTVSDTTGTRPSTETYSLGTFAQDWQYVEGSGDLDECNGRTGVTPEFPNGIYHYFATDSYPYFQRCVKGEVEGAGGPPPPL